MKVQFKKTDPNNVKDAEAGTVVLFVDVDGQFRVKDENGAVSYFGATSIQEEGAWSYLRLAANVNDPIETEGNIRHGLLNGVEVRQVYRDSISDWRTEGSE